MSDEPWLVVVDVQHGFADASASPWASPMLADALPRITGLMDAYGERVVLTRFVPQVPPEHAWADYYEEWRFAVAPDAGPLWDLLPEVRRDGLPVVDRPTFGKWGEELLAATGGSRRLVLCGVATDCCVLSTALPAADAGCWVTVVPDACAGSTPENHARALATLSLYAPQITLTPPASLTPGR